jgi:hypothetical protein
MQVLTKLPKILRSSLLNYRPLLQDLRKENNLLLDSIMEFYYFLERGQQTYQNPINLGETFNLMCNKNDPCPQGTP